MAQDNLVLEYLRSMRTDMSRLADRMNTVAVEMRATRQHVAGLSALKDHDHGELAQIKLSLDRIETRLELVD